MAIGVYSNFEKTPLEQYDEVAGRLRDGQDDQLSDSNLNGCRRHRTGRG